MNEATAAAMDANQARRRGTSGAYSKLPVETFKYSALQQDKDCTRLVRIEPAGKDGDPISCTLVDVAFGDRPKYQALSYTWGDETDKLTIHLNGAEFRVAQNLFDALQFLRQEPDRAPLWIDAISINQADVPERNRQLQMMPYIYFRADTTLVWLGKKYAKYELADAKEDVETGFNPTGNNASDEAIGPPTGSTVDGDCSLSPTSGRDTGVAFAEEVRTDGYWDRLWVIQEIGKAHRIQVCFGRCRVMDWDAFIKTDCI